MSQETVLLAYSGGLDTSCILKWLLEKNYNVICYIANIGQDEDFAAARAKALKIGASKVIVDDVRESFTKDYVWPAIQAGLIYESRYLLGTSLARPCISIGLVKYALENNASLISHGATGKGNDQIRFELSCYSLSPNLKIIAPWRIQEFTERFQGRQDLLRYASENQIPVSVTPKAPWSMDANLMHISYESGILENPSNEPPSDLYLMTRNPKEAPDEGLKLEIYFKKGLPDVVKVGDTGEVYKEPLGILLFLNKVAGEHGIGRIDIVENRFLGLKSRGVYETPGVHVLQVAHTDLETFTLDKEVFRVKQLLKDRLSDYVYNGFWFSPEADYVRKCLRIAAEPVNGSVKLELYKGNGRTSENSLYNEKLVSMDQHGDFQPTDATGFINIQALRLKEYHRYQKQETNN